MTDEPDDYFEDDPPPLPIKRVVPRRRRRMGEVIGQMGGAVAHTSAPDTARIAERKQRQEAAKQFEGGLSKGEKEYGAPKCLVHAMPEPCAACLSRIAAEDE